MATVTIGITPYDSYEDVTGADTYLAARIGADAWAALSADVKGQALVSATRRIQRFLATKVTTVPDPADEPAPDPIPDATSELAWILSQDASVQDASSAGSNTKVVKAGSAQVEFFRATDTRSTELPKTVSDLLGQYLTSVGALAGISPPFASGVATELAISSFLDEEEFGFNDEGNP